MDATEAYKFFMEDSESDEDEDFSSGESEEDEEPVLRSSMLWEDKNLVSYVQASLTL